MDILHQIGNSSKTFIIAEIGQNHQGCIKTAKQLIKVAKDSGADCVKFQKTCLEEKFTTSALDAPYHGDNSWGETYREHKEFLEFTKEEFVDLQGYARELDIFFTASAMDEKSLEFLVELEVPFIKIGSGDSNNFLLLEKAANTGVPLVVSTGMIDMDTTQEIYNLLSKYHKKFALLHCISSYPTPYDHINLKVVKNFQEKFSDILVGYSGHEPGIHISVSSVALGSKILERHITLDKSQKGSDHQCSLEPQELKQMINQIRDLELALGRPVKQRQISEEACFEKLGKSLVYSRNLDVGHVMGREDLKIKVSVPKGYEAQKYEDILEKVLKKKVHMDDPVWAGDFESFHLNKFVSGNHV